MKMFCGAGEPAMQPAATCVLMLVPSSMILTHVQIKQQTNARIKEQQNKDETCLYDCTNECMRQEANEGAQR